MIYYNSPCTFTGDTIVNNVCWSNVDQIAALSTNTLDEKEEETHQVHFMTNEVCHYSYFYVYLV